MIIFLNSKCRICALPFLGVGTAVHTKYTER